MPRTPAATPRPDAPVRVRRGYFDCRYGQLHMHHSMPAGGGFEEGTTLLCLHDAEGSGRVFAGLMSRLGTDRSTYAPDLPGCGESDPPAAPVAAAEYAAALGDFLDTMRLRRLDLLAYNAGAALAAELALSRATQVRRVVWVSDGSTRTPARQAAQACWSGEVALQYPLRERLVRLSQPLLMLRVRDEAGAARGGRESPPAARVVDFPQGSSGPILAGELPQALQLVREFLRG
ncbi:MAG: alpha/beta fold hydrolase [Proteobacteria bacterium]|nr:alpha/beta fold hydrolase [Pseudomonadota bacterium]